MPQRMAAAKERVQTLNKLQHFDPIHYFKSIQLITGTKISKRARLVPIWARKEVAKFYKELDVWQ